MVEDPKDFFDRFSLEGVVKTRGEIHEDHAGSIDGKGGYRQGRTQDDTAKNQEHQTGDAQGSANKVGCGVQNFFFYRVMFHRARFLNGKKFLVGSL